MAVPSSPVAAATAASQRKRKSTRVEEMEGKAERPDPPKEEGPGPGPKQAKRTKCPGIRVVGGRIYDSQNGKTCHQCRQKTMDFTAGCKNMKQDKQCTINFCHKCLLNRYGEKAEEMAALDDWKCPRCRGICNCSFCMKKRGHKPTGILTHTAKATGFSSVSELLDVKGPDVCQEVIAKSKLASSNTSTESTEGPVVVSPKKQGKENSFDGTCNTNFNSQPTPSIPDENKAKKAKREKPREKVEVAGDNGTVSSPIKDTKDGVRRSPRKQEIRQEVTLKKEEIDSDNCGIPSVVGPEVINKKKSKIQAEQKMKPRPLKRDASMIDSVVDVALPPGTLLTNVAGIDMLPEDTGYALQFLEFCSAFGEVLDIKKGQPHSVLRDIICGRSTRKGKCSSAVQFFIQLLSFMLKDMEEEDQPLSPSSGKDAWIYSLKRCLSESDFELEDIPEDCFDKGCHGYEMLQPTQKLKLLTFLCDESLSIIEMRNWIDDQNTKYTEKAKEAKETLNAAKEKEKLIKQKLQDEVAKAVIAKNGLPLTISEHESIVSEIKAEAERARAEMLEAKDLLPTKKPRSDAVRTEPVFTDDKGRAYWRFKCIGDKDLLLQDMGGSEPTLSNEKWTSFDTEETKVIEKHMSSLRLKRHWQNKHADVTKVKSSIWGVEVDSSSNDDSPPILTSS